MESVSELGLTSAASVTTGGSSRMAVANVSSDPQPNSLNLNFKHARRSARPVMNSAFAQHALMLTTAPRQPAAQSRAIRTALNATVTPGMIARLVAMDKC